MNGVVNIEKPTQTIVNILTLQGSKFRSLPISWIFIEMENEYKIERLQPQSVLNRKSLIMGWFRL